MPLILPEEVFLEYKEQTKGEINVSLPGVVLSYDSATQKATVQPIVRAWYWDEDDTAYAVRFPPIPRVPVAFFRAGGFAMSAPLEPGDVVTLLVQDRSIDEFMATGNADSTPFDVRRFDWTDAVALPFPPSATPITTLDADNMVLGSDTVKITMTPSGTLSIEGAGEELLQLLIDFTDICLTAQTGMGVPAFANKLVDLAALKASLTAMKA